MRMDGDMMLLCNRSGSMILVVGNTKGGVEGIEYLPMPIGRRKAFPNAASAGRSVIEQMPRDQKAVQELAAIVAAVFV